MEDYAKLTVANLRVILKDKGIPSTGLTRKQQIIEKLQEADRAAAEAAAQVETVETRDEPSAPPAADTEPPAVAEDVGVSSRTAASEEHVAREEAGVVAEDKAPEVEAPAEVMEEDTVAPAQLDGSAEEPVSAPAPVVETLPEQPAQEAVAVQETQNEETAQQLGVAANDEQKSVSQTPIPTQELPSAEQQSTPTIAATDVQSQALSEDSRKRKRRSATPPVDDEASAKKLKQAKDAESAAHDKQNGTVDGAIVNGRASDVAMKDSDTISVPADNDRSQNHVGEHEGVEAPGVEEQTKEPAKTVTNEESQVERSPDGKKDARLKSLSLPAALTEEATLSEPAPSQLDDGPQEPAIHPATSALYVRNFMRPLQPVALKKHLITLASPYDAEPDHSILVNFYVDPIRTHCLVQFSSLACAARARAALHNSIWPQERSRKPLWADFIPEEKIGAWIAEEEGAVSSGAGGRMGRRWEVVYEPDSSEEGGITASLREAGSDSSVPPPRGPAAADHDARIPTGPRKPDIEQNRYAPPNRDTITETHPPSSKDTSAPFLALDAIFRSTSAKPKLYYQPVDKDLAARRLDALDRQTSRDWKPGSGSSSSSTSEPQRRFAFDEGDKLVDVGPHFDGATASSSSAPQGPPPRPSSNRGWGRPPPPSRSYAPSSSRDALFSGPGGGGGRGRRPPPPSARQGFYSGTSGGGGGGERDEYYPRRGGGEYADRGNARYPDRGNDYPDRSYGGGGGGGGYRDRGYYGDRSDRGDRRNWRGR